MLPPETLEMAEQVLARLRGQGLKLATAESCTGGLIAAALTHIPGSSDVLERGFVTYSNEAKTAMLGVSAAMIETHGAVSSQVAAEMAYGAWRHSHAKIAISVTGVAGPGGGSADKPVGLVWFGLALRDGKPQTRHRIFSGDRGAIRAHSVAFVFEWLLSSL